jgi:SAM-dependent methyltransferase
MDSAATYLDTVNARYRAAALAPEPTLCCVDVAPFRLPDLRIPEAMLEMNYGCGTTVQPRDVPPSGSVLYLGVGSGLELLQFAALTRRPRGVIGVDAVPEMIGTCRANLARAQEINPWLADGMVELRAGNALDLPIEDGSVAFVAQNCLFNVFRDGDLDRALSEAHRVLARGGALSMSDPTCEQPIPESLRDDPWLRASCLSGALPLQDYLDRIVAAGFGTIEVRARRPYRVLDGRQVNGLSGRLFLDSVDVVARKSPIPDDGPCIFTGRTATWLGDAPEFDDGRGHVLRRGIPAAVCDKTAGALLRLGKGDIVTTEPTWHYGGGGCC